MTPNHQPVTQWPTTQPQDNFEDLDSFGGQYKPELALLPGIESLPNGAYDFEVKSARLDRASTSDRICELTLQVQGGVTVAWTHWLNKQAGVNEFCAHLAALGFDADKWNTPQRPLSREIPAAVSRLPGVRFRAVKSSREDTRPTHKGKVYHNLLIMSRIDGRPMPPIPPSVVQAPAPTAGVTSQVDPDQVPF